MSDLASIRRLSLSDLTQAALEDLVHHGEDLLVERKRDVPSPPKFGAAAGSFANTLGGWILLGVDDDGTVHGWEKDPQLDLQSHLGNLLRAQVDPLPPFVCDMREVDGKPIAVVRIFPSVDSPHIVRGTGAVYVRSSKGKEPVDDHRTLLELARRGEEAEAWAAHRLDTLPVVGSLLKAPNTAWQEEDEEVTTDLRFIIRAAPLTVTPALSEWPLTRRAADWCVQFAGVLVPPVVAIGGLAFRRDGPFLEPFGRAVAARVAQTQNAQTRDAALVAADSGGVLGIELRRGSVGGQRLILLEAMLDEEIRPLVTAIAALLYEAEAYGRAVVDLWIVQPPATWIHEQERDTAPRALHVSGELTIPADESEANALAVSWHRELQREVGIVKFEREPQPE